MLTAVMPALLEPFSCFPPASSSSSLLASRAAHLHSDWKALLTAFSASADLEVNAAAGLLQQMLLASSSTASSSASLSSSRSSVSQSVSVSSLTSHYHSERLSLLRCIVALFRLQLDDRHPYHEQAAAFIAVWLGQGGELRLLSLLRDYSSTECRPQSAADQRVREQAVMLQALFLVYYDSDNPAHQNLASVSLPERVTRLVRLLHDRQLMTLQACYLQLGEDGRRAVGWLRVLSLLLLLETVMLGKMRVISEHPVFRLLDDDERERWLSWRAGDAADGRDGKEARRREVQRMAADAQEEFDGHLFSDETLMQQMELALTAAGSPLLHPLLLLSWAVLLSLMLDFAEEMSSLQTLYDLPVAAPDRRSLSRDNVVQLLAAAMSFPSSPFACAVELLTVVASQPSLSEEDAAEPSASGYREIVNELLTAFCSSSLYPALVSSSQAGTGRSALQPEAELSRLFSLVMDGDNDLCYRWWQQQQQAELEQPLMTEAVGLFPSSLALLSMLTALAGQREEQSERVREDGLREERAAAGRDESEDDSSARDAMVCASQSFRTLLSLRSYAAPAQPASYYATEPRAALAGSSQQQQAANGWSLVTTQTCETADGVQIPAGSRGRLLRGEWVQWRVDWSAWPVLCRRLDRQIVSRCAAGPAAWAEVLAIVRLLSRLVSSHAELHRELQLHLLQSAARSPPLDLTSLMLRLLILMAAVPAASLPAGDGDGSSISLLAAIAAVLGASVQTDLVHFTRVFSATFADSAVQASLLPLQPASRAAETEGEWESASSVATAAFLQLVQILHSGIERAHGSYPLTLLLLRVAHAWVPHHYLSLLHLLRPAPSLQSFPIAIASPSSSSLLTAFASLSLSALTRYVSSEVFVPHWSSWRFASHSERLRVANACLRLFLVTLGHSLSVAADRALLSQQARGTRPLRSELAAAFSSSSGMQRALLLPLLDAAAGLDGPAEQRGRAQAAQREDLIVHSLFVVRHLLRIEKAASPSASSAASFHAALMQTLPSQHRSTARELLSGFTSRWRQPQSFVQAAVLLLSSPSSAEVQLLSLSTLRLLASSPSVSHSLSAVLQPLRRCLSSLLRSRSRAAPELKQAVFQLLAELVHCATPVSELLLMPDEGEQPQQGDREQKEEQYSERQPAAAADGGSPLVAALVSQLRETPALFASRPALLSSVFQLLDAVWAKQSPVLQQAVARPAVETGGLWQQLQFVLLQPLSSMPALGRSGGMDREEKEKRRADGDEDEDEAELRQRRRKEEEEQEVDGVEIAAAVQDAGHRLSIRRWALEIAAVEVFNAASQPPQALSSLLSSFLPGADSSGWQSDLSASSDDGRLRRLVHADSQRLRVDLALCRNWQQAVSSEDDSRGEFLLEVAHRLLYDDLIAAAAQDSLVALPGSLSSGLLVSSLSSSSYEPSQQRDSSQLQLAGGPLSLEAHREVMTAFLSSLSRLNALQHLAARQLLLCRLHYLLLRVLLLRQPAVLFPPASTAAPLAALETVLGLVSRQSKYWSSASQLASMAESCSWLSALLHHVLSSTAGRARLLTAAIVAESGGQHAASDAQLQLVYRRICLLLDSVLAAVLLACRAFLPATCLSQLRSQLHWLRQEATGADKLALSRCLDCLDEQREQQPQLAAEEADTAQSLLQSLVLSAVVLSRYASHLHSVHCLILAQPTSRPRSAHRGPDEAKASAGSRPSSSRPLSFTSPQSAAQKASAAALRLSPVIESQLEHGAAQSGGRGIGEQLTVLTQALLAVLCAAAEQPALSELSAAFIPQLLQMTRRTTATPPSTQADAVAESGELVSMSLELVAVDDAAGSGTRLGIRHAVLGVAALLPALLQRFRLLPVSAASEASTLLRLFSTLAETSAGAALLQEQGAVLCLCQHPVLNPPQAQALLLSPTGAASLSDLPSFSPYLRSGERDPWQLVWCQSLSLLSALVLQLSGHPAAVACCLQPLLAFRHRLYRVLQRRQQRRLTVGHLQEAEAATRYLSEVGRLLLRKRGAAAALDGQEAALLSELTAALLCLSDEYIRLLMDSRLLELRSLPVSAGERALAQQADSAVETGRRRQTEEKKEREAADTEEKKEEKQAEKRRWRPLGSGGPSSSSSLRQSGGFSSPPSQRRASASGGGGLGLLQTDNEAAGSADKGQRQRPSVIGPGAPALQSASFLLRSPLVAAMQRPSLTVPLTAEAAFAAWSPSAAAGQRDAASFAHRIEWQLCLVLRCSLSFLRLSSRADVGWTAARALLNYRSSVFEAQPLLGSGSRREAEEETELRLQEQRDREGEQEEYADLIEQDDGYDPYSMGDGQQRRPRPAEAAAAAVTSLLSPSAFAPSASYRPPLSVLIDFCRYCLHLLVRLVAINPLLHQQLGASPLAVHTQLAALSAPAAAEVAAPPPLSSILSLLLSLLEQSLAVLAEQAERHVGNIIAIFDGFNASAVKQRNSLQQQQQRQTAAARAASASALFSSVSAPAPSVELHPAALAAGRVHRVLETYRERLLVLSDEIVRYVSARSGLQLERRRSTHSPVSPRSGGAAAGGAAGMSASWSVASPPTASSPSGGSAGSAVAGSGGGGAGLAVLLRLRERLQDILLVLERHAQQYNE